MRPLNAVAPAAPRADEALLDRLAERIECAPRGLIVAGRQPDPELGRAGRGPGRGRGLSDPGRAHLAAAARAPRPLAGGLDLRRTSRATARRSSSPSWSSGSATCRPASRCASGSPRSTGLEQIVIDPVGEWREPTRRADTLMRVGSGGDRAVADGAAVPAASRGERRLPARPSPRAGSRPSGPCATPSTAASARWTSSASPASGRRWARALRDGDSVFAASSMPVRDLEAFLRPGPEGVRFASNRGANGIDGLVSTAAGLATGQRQRAPGRCSATSPSSTTSAGSPPLSACSGAAPDRDRQLGRRHLPLPAAGRGDAGGGVRGPARDAGRTGPCGRGATLRADRCRARRRRPSWTRRWPGTHG